MKIIAWIINTLETTSASFEIVREYYAENIFVKFSMLLLLKGLRQHRIGSLKRGESIKKKTNIWEELFYFEDTG